MLSRKRCRGTLQDYNMGEISKCQSKLWTNRNAGHACIHHKLCYRLTLLICTYVFFILEVYFSFNAASHC